MPATTETLPPVDTTPGDWQFDTQTAELLDAVAELPPSRGAELVEVARRTG